MQAAIRNALRDAIAAAGRELTYRRGDQAVQLRAIRGRTEYTATDAAGTQITAAVPAYILVAEDFPLGDPAEGDTIEELTAAGTRTTEVQPPAAGQQCYRRTADAALRIFTRETARP